MSLKTLRREFDALRARRGFPRRGIPTRDSLTFATEQLGFTPDPWQEDVLTSRHPRKMLCCCRQSGKTTVAAILALHKALARPGATVLIVGPGERQAKILFSKVKQLYRRVQNDNVSLKSDRITGMELTNGSAMEALPAIERTTRGYSVDLLIVDEAAGVPDHDYHGLLPTLAATKGDQVLLSTPRGKRGFFSSLWHGEDDGVRAGADFEKTLITATDTPRIGDDDLAVFKKSMPERWFRQEFFCEFLEADDAIFSQEIVLGAVSEAIEAVDFTEVGW